MNEKDLKKLNRKQLLELLLKQTQRADDLQKRINELEDELKNISTIQKILIKEKTAKPKKQIKSSFEN